MPKNTKVVAARIERDFTNHRPDENTQATMESLRAKIKAVASVLYALPESRERSLAITNLEQTTMWSMAALARGNYDESLNN